MIDEEALKATRQAEVSAGMFEDMLRAFVGNWAPSRGYERDRFQMDLTRLMAQAMRHQSATYAIGIEHYSVICTQLAERSMTPLRFIHEKPKEKS